MILRQFVVLLPFPPHPKNRIVFRAILSFWMILSNKMWNSTPSPRKFFPHFSWHYFSSWLIGNFSLDENQAPLPATLPPNFISPIDRGPFETYIYKVLGTFTEQFFLCIFKVKKKMVIFWPKNNFVLSDRKFSQDHAAIIGFSLQRNDP